MCIGCGICQSIAGTNVIEVAKTTTGYQRPVVIGDLTDDVVDTIYDVCPGTRVDGLPAHLVDEQTNIDLVWGPWRRIVRAWAADPEVRFEGSTGGVLTALGQYLLDSERVKFVLHTKASSTEPTFGERSLSFTREEVFNSGGSRYGPTPTLIDVLDVLDRGEPFAFIGKPCDIGALRNWGRHDSRVDELVRYWLTPVCGGYGPPSFTSQFVTANGIDPNDVTALRDRGRGCPGPTRIETADTTIARHYLDYWGDDESQWSLPWRCKICPDGIGEAADIAASDTRIGGSPNRIDSETDPGTNAIIARTAVGIELLESAERDGALTLEYDITPEDLTTYQPHQMRKKFAVGDRFAGMADEDRIVPHINRLQIAELAAEVAVDLRERQRAGTRERIRIGKATEPTPVAY